MPELVIGRSYINELLNFCSNLFLSRHFVVVCVERELCELGIVRWKRLERDGSPSVIHPTGQGHHGRELLMGRIQCIQLAPSWAYLASDPLRGNIMNSFRRRLPQLVSMGNALTIRLRTVSRTMTHDASPGRGLSFDPRGALMIALHSGVACSLGPMCHCQNPI